MTVIGRVEYLADIDGQRLPAEARRVGRQIGRELARGANRGFVDFRGADQIEAASARISRSLMGQSSAWKQLSHNTRQWILISSAVAAAGSDIAALGSAAGAGLTVLGAAFSSLLIGGGTAIAVFKGLNGELEDLDPAVRPAAEAFQSLGRSFGDLRKQIQVRALRDAGSAFATMESTVRELAPAFETVADHVGVLIRDFASGLRPGTRNFENLNRLVRASGPIFERLMRNVGTFGEGLLEAFSNPAMTRSVNQFIDWLDELAEGFLEFTQNGGLEIWLSRGERVFGSFGELLKATGKLLDDLVDEAAVDRLVGLIDNLTRFMPNLERFLSIIGELDVFGLIAQALADLGEALEPLAVPMEELFDALNRIVSIAIDQWAERIGGAAEAIAPFVQTMADFLRDVDEEDIRGIADALLALAAGAVILKGAQGLAGLGLAVTTNLGGLATVMKANDWKALGTKFGKGGAAAFFPALIAGLFTGEGGAGMTIGAGTIVGLQFGGLPGAVAGALIGAIVSMFTDPGSWANGLEQITTFFGETLPGLIGPAIGTLAAATVGLLGQAFVGVGAFFIALPGLLGESIATFAAVTVGLLGQAFVAIGAVFIAWFAQTGATWNSFWGTIGAFVATAWATITTTIGTALANILTGMLVWWGSVTGGWNAFWAGVSTTVTTVWNAIVTWIQTKLEEIRSFIATKVGEIRAGWDSGWAGISAAWSGFWGGIVGVVSGAVSTIEGWISGLIGWIGDAVAGLQGLFGMASSAPSPGGGGGGGGMASGGLANFAQRRLIGEAGMEAVVPLQRPLSQIDPSVRMLAAFAQGKLGSMGGGTGKQVIFQEGSIIVQTVSPDGRLVAESVVDNIVANSDI